jgi:hypothetical protein
MHPFANLAYDDVILDALPDDVVATMQVRDRFLTSLGLGGALGLEFIVSDLRAWAPGQTVRVAFLGGDPDLHGDIAEATREITDACNLTFDFGENNGGFRTWSENDTEYSADIRVSFDQSGYFSLVGTDSVNEVIGSPFRPVGGRPFQRSLNLGGFPVHRPQGWQGTVRHEFLHAVSFHHSHQNMRGPCEEAFRWEDDEDYQLTHDANGRAVVDANGRRPGIYTYLAGFPNFWDRAKVDHNLRTEESPDVVAGPFDRHSVMLYRFPPLFYKTEPSACAPLGQGISLSDEDKRGLQLLYPGTSNEVAAIAERRRGILSAIEGSHPETGRLESAAAPVDAHLSRAAKVLRLTLDAM